MELGLNKLPWYGQIGAFLLVAIALFVVFQIHYIGPQLEAQAQKRAELERKLAEVEQAEQDAIELAAFQAEVDDLNNRLEAPAPCCRNSRRSPGCSDGCRPSRSSRLQLCCDWRISSTVFTGRSR